MPNDRSTGFQPVPHHERSERLTCPLAGPIITHPIDDELVAYCAQPNVAYENAPTLDQALAFEAVIRKLHQQQDIVPLRFAPPSTSTTLQTWLHDNRHDLAEKLRNISGTCQVNVRWKLPVSARVSNDLCGAVSGKSYLQSRARSTLPEREIENQLCALIEELKFAHPELRAAQPARSNVSHEQVVGIDCWLPRDTANIARSWLAAVVFRDQSPAYVSEALPPYSFVS